MQIAFPSQENLGLNSPVYGHFGSARFFILVDTDTGAVQCLENADQHHLHGQCQPLKALNGVKVDAVAVGGIGKGALNRLQAEGIKVYRAQADRSVADNLALLQTGDLPGFSPFDLCGSHTSGDGCAHH